MITRRELLIRGLFSTFVPSLVIAKPNKIAVELKRYKLFLETYVAHERFDLVVPHTKQVSRNEDMVSFKLPNASCNRELIVRSIGILDELDQIVTQTPFAQSQYLFKGDKLKIDYHLKLSNEDNGYKTIDRTTAERMIADLSLTNNTEWEI